MQALFAAVAAYLGEREPWTEAVGALRTAAARVLAPHPAGAGSPIELQLAALAPAEATLPVVRALQDSASLLRWQQNATYRDAAFLRRYAYCELLGPAGIVAHSAFSAGFLYLAPNTFYPPHAHPAEEAYHVLAGDGLWQQGDGDAVTQPAGARVLHRPGASHSMRSAGTPLLAFYLWRGDIAAPARIIG